MCRHTGTSKEQTMAVIDIAPSPQQALQKAGALSASRRFDSAPPLSGVVLPSLMEEAMLEAELAFAAYDGVEDFTTAVRRAAESAGGAFLFELPASSLLPGSRRIAVIALPSGEEFIPAFACTRTGPRSASSRRRSGRRRSGSLPSPSSALSDGCTRRRFWPGRGECGSTSGKKVRSKRRRGFPCAHASAGTVPTLLARWQATCPGVT